MRQFEIPGVGLRNVSEFIWGGEVTEPCAEAVDDRTWAASLWNRENARGEVQEWWFHVPTHLWIIITRNTDTDQAARPGARV